MESVKEEGSIMDSKQHINVVITNFVASNSPKFFKMLSSKFDLKNTTNEWSITIKDRAESTIGMIKKLVGAIPHMSNKSIYEISYFNDDWTRSKTITEVFKILPTSVFCEKVIVLIDTVIDAENCINASHRTIHNIYGLWDNPETMPMFMKTLRYDMKSKCEDFRTLLHNSDDIREFINDNTWDFLQNKIKRKVVLADISRYYLMWRRGGMYLDLDVRVNDDLKYLIKKCVAEGNKMLLFTEHDSCDPEAMGPMENKAFTHRLYNCMFWSIPGETFWKNCIDLAINRCNELLAKKEEWSDVDILWASGPDIITTVYHTKFEDCNYIKVFNNDETRKLLVHMNGGTWRNNKDIK